MKKQKFPDSIYELPILRSRTICWSREACDAALQAAGRAVLAAEDLETIPYKKPSKMKVELALPEFTRVYMITVVAMTFLSADGHMDSFAFPLCKSKDAKSGPPVEIEYILETIRKINELDLRFTFHNGSYDLIWLLYYGMPVKNYAYDSMTMFWSIYPDLPKRLDFVSSILLKNYRYWKGGRKDDDFTNYMVYAMSDTESTLCNTIVLARILTILAHARRNFFHAHLRCMSGIVMSFYGLAVDESVMEDLRVELQVDADKALKNAQYLIGKTNQEGELDFNPNSTAQKTTLVYKLLGTKPRNAKGKVVGEGAKKSTGAMALKSIRNEHPLFRRVLNSILDAITPAKQISNVIKMPRFMAGPTGSRLLSSYDGVGTTTTRYSSRASSFGHGSNAQNIRKDYRRFARADSHSVLVEIDFSGADDVFVGFESGEPKKIELIRSGRDIHATNALIFFLNWTYDAIVAGKNAVQPNGKKGDPRIVHPITGIRQITKKLVHGSHYLMAGATLLATAGREAIVAAALEEGYSAAGLWNQDQLASFCELLITRFRNHYPRFRLEQAGSVSWYYDLRKELKATGGFTTWFGYHQSFLSDPSEDSTLRAVAATAGQAGTAGRVNMVLDELVHGYIPERFRDAPNPHAGAQPRMVSEHLNGITVRAQTHDSITFNINYRHPKWQDGFAGILESFSRPCVIRDEVFSLGWEADAGIYWADPKGVGIKSVLDLEQYINYRLLPPTKRQYLLNDALPEIA